MMKNSENRPAGRRANPWVEAMRLRTLPVSVAGVLSGTAVALMLGGFKWLPALLCLVFALLAQIASNFANEYFDYKNGLDRKGREGFRRGVTEGDISPKAMLAATLLTLASACAIGLSLIYWGGWMMLPIGILIAIFALAYSAGPYPLSHHGLGDVAVVVFFGVVPVTLTAWLQLPGYDTVTAALPVSVGVGILAANVLIVNNYRDMEDDAAVNKRTTVVIFGRGVASAAYLLDAVVGLCLIWIPFASLRPQGAVIAIAAVALTVSIAIAVSLYIKLRKKRGAALNKVLKSTAQLLLYTALLMIAAALS